MSEHENRTQPVLKTERLILRPFAPAEAPAVQRLARDRAVADTTEQIPRPNEDGMAEAWIAMYPRRLRERRECGLAIVLKDRQQLIGAVGLTLTMAHSRGELGVSVRRSPSGARAA